MRVPSGKSPKTLPLAVWGCSLCRGVTPHPVVKFVLYMPISMKATLIPGKMMGWQ